MGYMRDLTKLMGRYIPEGSTPREFPEVNAVAYLSQNEAGDRFYAIGYSGKRNKSDFNYRFRSAEARDKYVAEWVEGLKRTAAYKAERKALRVEAPMKLKVGDIVHTSWGYDQTNTDFFQIVKMVGKRSVSIRKISAPCEETGFMSGTSVAIKDAFIGEPVTRLVSNGDTVCNADGNGHYGFLGSRAYTSWYA